MTLPLRQTVLSAGLGLALAAAPTSPARAQGPTADDVADIKRMLADVQTDVTKLRNKYDQLDAAVTRGRPAADGDGRQVDDMDARLKAVEAAVARIEQKLGDMSRTAGSSPVGRPAVPTPMAPAVGSRATVRIANEYPAEVSVIVNRNSYRVAPNEVRAVDVPAGAYTYEVLMEGSRPTTSPIRDGETVTLRIR